MLAVLLVPKTGAVRRGREAPGSRTADHLAQDQQRPPLPEHIEPTRDRAVLVVVPSGVHTSDDAQPDMFLKLQLDFLVLSVYIPVYEWKRNAARRDSRTGLYGDVERRPR